MGSLEGRSFQWSDGSTVNFLNWANGEPNNHQDQEGTKDSLKSFGRTPRKFITVV